MLQAIGTIISLIIGFMIWGFTLLLSKGAYPFGPTGGVEIFVFFAPIVCLVVPAAIQSFGHESPAQGVFLLAIAPIAGFLNFIPVLAVSFVVMAIFGKSESSIFLSAFFCQFFWAYVLWSNLNQADNIRNPNSQSRKNQEPYTLAEYSGILQIIGLLFACFVAYIFLKR